MFTQDFESILELPALPALPEFEFRALRRDDVPALYEMLLAVEKADERNLVDTLADLQREYDDPWCGAETDSLAAFTPAGQLAGLARTLQNPQPEGEVRCHLSVEVQPSQRAKGLEDALLDWAVERGRQRLLLASSAAPVQHGCCVSASKTRRRSGWRGWRSVVSAPCARSIACSAT